MPRRTSGWTRSVGRTLVHGLVLWGVWAGHSLVARDAQGPWRWVPILVPLPQAGVTGARIRSRWWVRCAPAAVVPTSVAYPTDALATTEFDGPDAGPGIASPPIFAAIYARPLAVAAAMGTLLGDAGVGRRVSPGVRADEAGKPHPGRPTGRGGFGHSAPIRRTVGHRRKVRLWPSVAWHTPCVELVTRPSIPWGGYASFSL